MSDIRKALEAWLAIKHTHDDGCHPSEGRHTTKCKATVEAIRLTREALAALPSQAEAVGVDICADCAREKACIIPMKHDMTRCSDLELTATGQQIPAKATQSQAEAVVEDVEVIKDALMVLFKGTFSVSDSACGRWYRDALYALSRLSASKPEGDVIAAARIIAASFEAHGRGRYVGSSERLIEIEDTNQILFNGITMGDFRRLADAVADLPAAPEPKPEEAQG